MTAGESAAVAALIAAVFAWTCAGLAPSVSWLDTGNLAASAWVMGVAHPPGEAGWLAPTRLFQLLPMGDIALRANLLAAAALAAVAWPLAALVRSGEVERRAPEGLAPVLAVGLGLLGFSAQLQGVRAEVYSLTALCLLGALAAAVAWSGRAGSALAGLLIGVAATVHPLLTAAAVPAVAVARLLRARRWGTDAAVGVGFGLVGFAAQAWLPLRALAVPERAWGVPSTWERFVDVMLARTFARNFGAAVESAADPIANLGVVAELDSRAGGILLVLLAAASLLFPGARARALLLALPVWWLGNAATVLPQNKVFADNPDLHGYLWIGLLPLVAGAGLGARVVVQRAGVWKMPSSLVMVVVVGWLLALASDGTRAHRPEAHSAGRFGAELAYRLPTGALLVTAGNDSAFVWSYLDAVERRRPDLLLVHRVLLGHAHERLRLAGLEEAGLPWHPVLRTAPLSVIPGSVRPAYLEVREPELPALADGRLWPHGLVAGWSGRAGSAETEPDELRRVRAAVLGELDGSGVGEVQAHLVAAYFRELRGDR